MEIGIRLHDTAGSNLDEHLRNAREQGFSCVHIAMSKVVPGFKMADAPELLTDALADEVRGLLEKYNQRCVLLGCYLNLCSPDLSAHERTLMNYRAHLRFGKKIGALMVGTETGAPNIGYKSCPECRTEESQRLFIERVERLEEEKKAIADDIRDVYAEAKAQGYDPKIMRQIVRLRKMQPHVRQEMEAVLETYKAALGLE